MMIGMEDAVQNLEWCAQNTAYGYMPRRALRTRKVLFLPDFILNCRDGNKLSSENWM